MKCKSNIAVIGCGNWGRNIVRVLSELGHLYAICDSDEKKAIGFISNHKITPYSDVIMTDKEVDAVMIATPSETHYQLATKALRLDKDVFVEKPMVLSSNDGKKLVELAEKKGRILMVGHVLLYHPIIEDMKRNLGKLGGIKSFFSTRYGWVKFKRRENVWWTFGTHDVALMLHFMEGIPNKCRASGDKDFGQASFLFGKSKKAYVQICWQYPLKRRELIILGQNDNFIYSFNEYDKNFLRTTDREPLWRECQHFIDCIKTRQTPLTNGKHGLEVVKILEECDSQCLS